MDIGERLSRENSANLLDSTDTSVILALYLVYGLSTSFFGSLNGEFAFIIWDASSKRLVAARDRFGVKPLYWTHDKNRIALSSEIKAFLTLQNFERRFNTGEIVIIPIKLRTVHLPFTLSAWLDTLEPGFSHPPNHTFMKVCYTTKVIYYLISFRMCIPCFQGIL